MSEDVANTVVVGAGVFGQTIGKALQEIGHKVIIMDSREPMAGSRPSACLMRPSWFASMGVQRYKPSLELLDRLYGVQDIRFDLWALKGTRVGSAAVHWCDPRKVLAGPVLLDKAISFQPAEGGWVIKTQGGRELSAANLILAAGVWTNSLVNLPTLTGKVGVAFLFPEHKVPVPFILPWAPYKQVVAFNHPGGLWVGDGSAIKQSNWTEEHVVRSYKRCRDSIGIQDSAKESRVRTIQGVRPYVSGLSNPCLLLKRPNNLWIATGGAKNGMVASGWAAGVIQHALR